MNSIVSDICSALKNKDTLDPQEILRALLELTSDTHAPGDPEEEDVGSLISAETGERDHMTELKELIAQARI